MGFLSCNTLPITIIWGKNKKVIITITISDSNSNNNSFLLFLIAIMYLWQKMWIARAAPTMSTTRWARARVLTKAKQRSTTWSSRMTWTTVWRCPKPKMTRRRKWCPKCIWPGCWRLREACSPMWTTSLRPSLVRRMVQMFCPMPSSTCSISWMSKQCCTASPIQMWSTRGNQIACHSASGLISSRIRTLFLIYTNPVRLIRRCLLLRQHSWTRVRLVVLTWIKSHHLASSFSIRKCISIASGSNPTITIFDRCQPLIARILVKCSMKNQG